MSENKPINQWFGVTSDEIKHLFEFKRNPAGLTKLLLIVVAALLTPITLIGALLGYRRAFMQFLYPKGEMPELYPLAPIVRVAMILGAIAIWAVIIVSIGALIWIIPHNWLAEGYLFYYVVINLVLSIGVFFAFRKWRESIANLRAEEQKFGSARLARQDELTQYIGREGFYIGDEYTFADNGHLLTCAGTRSGKFTDIIAPNLLGVGGYQGSWVVIDPKGEVCAVTARYQTDQKKNVVILNPWGILPDNIPKGQSYNPLDILSDKSNIHLVDDAQVIAEMIVPVDKNDNEKFFADNARSIVAGLLLHMATTIEKKDCTLTTLWKWIRLPKEEFNKLLEDMAVNDHPVFGEAVKQSSNEIVMLRQAGDRTYGSIIAVVLQCTDFIKSPALQKCMESGYDPAELSDGNTALYVIIPADKLQSHSRWLRLVVVTTMRAVVRKPNKRVCFMLDEFASLGHLSEISEVALSTFAGFNISVWIIIQSLIQLKNLYGDGWENFIGNTGVRHFFGVNDNFTADYISAAIGMSSNLQKRRSWFGVTAGQANARPLITPDEVRRGSGHFIFGFFGSKPVTYFEKKPYYEMGAAFEDNGALKFNKNPYYKG